MKKLVVAFIFLALIVTGATLEIVYLERTYDGVLERLARLEQAIDADIEHVDNPETLAAVEEVAEYWKSRRKIGMSILNHTQTKNVDDRLAAVMRQCEVNANQDAAVGVRGLIYIFTDLKQDTYPNLTNML